jgi:hypothetical protein
VLRIFSFAISFFSFNFYFYILESPLNKINSSPGVYTSLLTFKLLTSIVPSSKTLILFSAVEDLTNPSTVPEATDNLPTMV